MDEIKKNIIVRETENKDSEHDSFFTYEKNHQEFYDFDDNEIFLGLTADLTKKNRLFILDKLLARDKLREKDGFPRKIKLGKLIKPSKDTGDRSIVIPTAAEEKFYHWDGEYNESGGPSTGGSGEEQEGEVIGEESLRPEEGEGEGAGHGKSGEHGMSSEAYELGRILTEQFELPNIKEKGKKTSLTKYSYELSDRNRGHGQILDKKATLKRVVKTNLALGKISRDKKIDTTKLIISPTDRMYRILSRERDYESQAMVFFVRDYSGSMQGKPTEVVVSQHIYIHSWLVYQYKKQVVSRFILHDTEALEVPDFYTYYNKNVAGGTEIASAYSLVNKIVEEESLIKNYNIYIFQGTDGDDWNDEKGKAMEELEKMCKYASRIGVTIAENTYTPRNASVVEKSIRESKLLEKFTDKLHIDSFRANEADEDRLIKGIKILIS